MMEQHLPQTLKIGGLNMRTRGTIIDELEDRLNGEDRDEYKILSDNILLEKLRESTNKLYKAIGD